MNQLSRWKTSLHESGHLMAGKILLRDEMGYAVVLPTGGGIAFTGDEAEGRRLTFNEILGIVVGPVAERLAERHNLPDEIPKPSSVVEPGPPEKSEYTNFKSIMKTTETDSVKIAKWCVLECPDNPERWVQRYRWIHREAERFVRDYESEIVKIARKLFCGGIVFLSKGSNHDQTD
jgi:hypothetical protein